MPNGKSRKKGWRGEYKFRKLCKYRGFWTTWHNNEREKPDLTFLDDTTCEVKYGTKVPKKLYKWLNEKNPDILAIKRISKIDKNNPWLIVMTADHYFGLRKKEN